MSSLRVASIVLVLGSACAVEESTSAVDQELPVWGGCDDWGCGMNSPEIDHLGMHDLHGVVGGTPNANGFVVTGIEKRTCGGSPITCTTTKYDRVYSANGELRASGSSGSLGGGAIVGLVIRVANSANKYVITVAEKGRNVKMWAKITGTEQWPVYNLKWDVDHGEGQKNEWKGICTRPPLDGNSELLGMNGFHSVVFENDEIDAAAKVVVGTRPEKHWFNIGCAGHAIAKLLLTGNTSAADAKFGFTSSFDDKTAALKMITADYCGKGFPFTVAGQPLAWADRNYWNKYPMGFSGMKEAEWTSSGVSCLNKPRVYANPTALGTATFPDLALDIKAACGGKLPPPCKDDDAYNHNGAFYLSSNP